MLAFSRHCLAPALAALLVVFAHPEAPHQRPPQTDK